jgi:alpha-tubulin suppressor-like RCC1 family protein
LQCWGEAQPFVGDDPDPTEAPVTSVKVKDVAGVSCNLGELAVRLRDGRVMMWESYVSIMYYMGPGMKAFPGFCLGCVLPGMRDVTQVASGINSHCVLDKSGAVACWGENKRGQFGDGTIARDKAPPTRVPRSVSGIGGAVEVGVSEHVCARLNDGKVACWGENAKGQIGDGTTGQRLRPTLVAGLAKAEQIAVGRDHSCARVPGGTVVCWGSNEYGGLGIGTRDPHKALPTPVVGLTGVASVFAGGYSSCAIGLDGSVWCWGGVATTLGGKTKVDETRPVRVMF